MRLLSCFGVFSLILLMFAGCSPSSKEGSSAGQGTSRLTVLLTTGEQSAPAGLRRVVASGQLRVAPGDPGFVTRLEVRITAADIDPPITQSFALSETQQTDIIVELRVPVGTNRRIIVTVFNADDVAIFGGETTVDLIQAEQVVTRTLQRQELILTAAVTADIANQTFVFTDGAVFGLPGVEVTLAIGAFADSTGLFTLSSNGLQASGSITLTVPAASSSRLRQQASGTPCTLQVALSTYPPGQGPQTGDTLSLTCQTDAVDGRLLIENASTMAQATSNAPRATVNITFPFILDVSRLDDLSVVLVEQAQ